MASIIDGKNKFEILNDFVTDYFPPDNKDHQIRKLAIQVRCVEDIEKSIITLEASINKNAESSTNLARKVVILNIILASATVVMAAFTVLTFFCAK